VGEAHGQLGDAGVIGATRAAPCKINDISDCSRATSIWRQPMPGSAVARSSALMGGSLAANGREALGARVATSRVRDLGLGEHTA